MDGGIKPASLGQVAAALSLSIGTQSESEIQAQKTAQKLMLVGKGLIDKMATDTKAALAASKTAQDLETAASILLVVATFTMGVSGAMESSEALSETSTLGKISKKVNYKFTKPVQVIGFAGSSVALMGLLRTGIILKNDLD